MHAVKRVVHLSLIIVGIIVAFCLIGFKLGCNELILVGNVDLPIWLVDTLGCLVCLLQTFLMFGYISRDYTARAAYVFICFIPLSLLTNEFINYALGMIGTTLIPVLYVITVYSIINKNAKVTLQLVARTIFILAASTAYQLAIMLFKLTAIHTSSSTFSTYEWLVCSVDMCLLLLLFYALGGINSYEEKRSISWPRSWEHSVFPEDLEAARLDQLDIDELTKWQQMRGHLRVAAVALLILIQTVQWSIILVVCAIGNVFIEGLILTVCFVVFGFVVQRRWHTNSVIKCTLLCSLTFYLAAKAIPSFGYTQIMPVIVGMILIYASYRASLLSVTEEASNGNSST